MESHKDLPPLPCCHGPDRSTHARAEAAGERRRAPAVRASEIPASLATLVSKQGAQACPLPIVQRARAASAGLDSGGDGHRAVPQSPGAGEGAGGQRSTPRPRARAFVTCCQSLR